MILSLIAAASTNDVIGDHGQIPWHLPDDLVFFRTVTKGHPVVMGRKTYESIGRPLPARTNIIVTRNPSYTADGCIVVSSLDEAIIRAEGEGAQEAFIIGGGELYALALPRADRIYLTRVHVSVGGDAFFPALDPSAWTEVHREDHAPDDRHAHSFTFLTYEKTA